MQTKKVKVPKNIYNWVLCREHCSLTEIVHSVESILHNKEDYSYDATAMDVCDWAEEQEDMITTLFYMKRYGVAIEEEKIVNCNSIKGYKLESCGVHSYYRGVEHDSFYVDKVAYYDLQIVIPNKPITICNLTYGEAEELVEFIQEALKVEADTTQVTWRELVDIVHTLCYGTYTAVLNELLYKNDLQIFNGHYYEWHPDYTDNCMTINFSLAEGSLFDNYKNGLPLMDIVVYVEYYKDGNEWVDDLKVKLDNEGIAKAIKFINNHMERIAQDEEVNNVSLCN